MTTRKKKPTKAKAKPAKPAKPTEATAEAELPKAAVGAAIEAMARVMALEILNLPVFGGAVSPEQRARDRVALAQAKRALGDVPFRIVGVQQQRGGEMVTDVKGIRNNVKGTWSYAGPKSVFVPDVQILALKPEYTYLALNGNSYTLAVMELGACIGWVDVVLLGHQTVVAYLAQVGRDALLARAEAEGRWPRATPTPAAGRLVAPPIPAPKAQE